MELSNKSSNTRNKIKKKEHWNKIIHQKTICSTKPSFKNQITQIQTLSIQIDNAPKTSQSYISNSQRFIVSQI